MRWEPIDPPHTQAQKSIYKKLVRLRAAFILLLSAWHMKPRYFQPDTDSFYKNLGRGIPFLPASVYAIGAQAMISNMLPDDLPPAFPTRDWFLWVVFFGNIILIGLLVYFKASAIFCFHSVMCFIGRVFKMQENPPSYDFFLVRISGQYMWFGVFVSLMGLPALASASSIVGKWASLIVTMPVIYLAIVYIAGYSWQREQNSAVWLKQMYQSERFIKFFIRTELTIALVLFSTLVILARNPDYVSHLLGR